MTTATVFAWVLTPHERAALLTMITEHMTSEKGFQVSIDAASGEEITPGELFTKLMLLDPLVLQRPAVEEGHATPPVCPTCGRPR